MIDQIQVNEQRLNHDNDGTINNCGFPKVLETRDEVTKEISGAGGRDSLTLSLYIDGVRSTTGAGGIGGASLKIG